MFINPSDLSLLELKSLKSLFIKENSNKKNVICNGFVINEFPISWKVIRSLQENMLVETINGEVKLTSVGIGIAKRLLNRKFR